MRIAAIALTLGWLLTAASAAVAAPPADQPDFTDYYITKNHGPWMIYVASFSGDEAKDLAFNMVSELRRDFKLPAYLYSRSDMLRREQKKRIEDFRKEHGLDETVPVKRERVIDEYVVLIGNYKDMDAASKALDKQREQFKTSDKVPMKEYFSKLFMGLETTKDKDGKATKDPKFDKSSVQTFRENPLVRGMVVPNPHEDAVKARQEARAKEVVVKFDPEWKDLNKDEKYSLLKNNKKYTLVVKVFQGSSVIAGVKTPSVFTGDQAKYTAQMSNELDKAIKKAGKNLSVQGFEAHNLAEMMRHKDFNYEAYVFHTREYSLVTIGSFDRPDDANLLKLQSLLKGQRFGELQLSEGPAVMEVPKP